MDRWKWKYNIEVSLFTLIFVEGLVWFMVVNATFNNILVISWQSVLLVEDLEKTTDLPHITNKLYHINVVLSTPCHERGSIGCIGSCKSNYCMFTTTTPHIFVEGMENKNYLFDTRPKTVIYQHFFILDAMAAVAKKQKCSPLTTNLFGKKNAWCINVYLYKGLPHCSYLLDHILVTWSFIQLVIT